MTPEPNRPDEREALRFGDRVVNLVASEDNPRRYGIFVRRGSIPAGRMNAGPYIELTDGRGDFWRVGVEHIRRDATREGASVDDAMVERAWMALTGRDKCGEAYANDASCMMDCERRQVRAALTAALADRAPREGGEADIMRDGNEGPDYWRGYLAGRAVPPPDAPERDAVGALVGNWRKLADTIAEAKFAGKAVRAVLLDCADELAAALAARAQDAATAGVTEASFVGWWREDGMTPYVEGESIGQMLSAGWKPVGFITPEEMSAALSPMEAKKGADRG